MNAKQIMTPIGLCFLLLTTACGQFGFSDSAAKKPEQEIEMAVKSLNELSQSQPKQFYVNFTILHSVDAYDVSIICYYPPERKGTVPNPVPAPVYAPNLRGMGYLAAPGMKTPDNLIISATYDAKISPACQEIARKALKNGRQLRISGEATILPLWSHPGVAEAHTSESAQNVSEAHSQASSIRVGLTSPPVFYSPQVNVVFDKITSCEEGEVSPFIRPEPPTEITVCPQSSQNSLPGTPCPPLERK